jgi:prephenate dehydratase
MILSNSVEVRNIYTLGPSGTNCEAAAKEYFKRTGINDGNVFLFSTLEEAMEEIPQDGFNALLGCVVYPDLHDLVFKNLSNMELVDTFIFPTFNMILASKTGEEPSTVITHPAPKSLLDSRPVDISFANSNAEAAYLCASGITQGCITTAVSAKKNNLKLVEDFGPVPMGFTIHQKKSS